LGSLATIVVGSQQHPRFVIYGLLDEFSSYGLGWDLPMRDGVQQSVGDAGVKVEFRGAPACREGELCKVSGSKRDRTRALVAS